MPYDVIQVTHIFPLHFFWNDTATQNVDSGFQRICLVFPITQAILIFLSSPLPHAKDSDSCPTPLAFLEKNSFSKMSNSFLRYCKMYLSMKNCVIFVHWFLMNRKKISVEKYRYTSPWKYHKFLMFTENRDIPVFTFKIYLLFKHFPTFLTKSVLLKKCAFFKTTSLHLWYTYRRESAIYIFLVS